MEPPKMRFLTPIYHPNIDDAGRICLDSLKMPPAGSWKPALNLSTLLTTLQLLLAEPNPDDPLMTDIANEYRYNRPLFEQHAREWTEKHAIQTVKPSTTEGQQVASGKKSGPQYSSSESESSDEEMDQENVGMTSISRKRQVVDQADNTLQENVKKLKP